MKLIKAVLALFIFSLLIVPSVFALEIIDSKLFFNSNVPVNYYANNREFVANLEVKLRTDNLSGVTFNISNLHNNYFRVAQTNNYDSLDVSRAACEDVGDGTFTCVLRNRRIRISSSDIEIFVNKNDEVASRVISLQRSTASPKVTFIGTDNCIDDKCYVKSGRNDFILKFEGSDAGFSRGIIGFGVGASTAPVSGCEDNECTGNINIQCRDNQAVSATLRPFHGMSSSDDIGIAITSQSFSLICDSTPPQIREIGIIEARDLGITTISESFTIKAKIYDSSSPEINMLVVGESVGSANISGVCAKHEGFFDCTATVRSLVKERGTYSLPVIFSDAAGNEVSDSVSVELVEVQRDLVPNFWRVGKVVQSSNSLTIRNMAYNRDVFVEVDFQGDADLLSASISNFRCLPVKDEETGNRNDITDLRIVKFDKEKNKIYLKLTLRGVSLTIKEDHIYSGFSSLEYNCGLNLNSRKDGFYYATPEQKNFTVKFDLSEGHTLDEHIYERIDKINEDLKKQNARLDSLEQGLNMVQSLCKSLAHLDEGKKSSAITQILLESSIVGAPVAQGMKGVTSTLDELSTVFNKFGAAPCEMISCQSSWVDDFYGDTLGLSEVKDMLKVDEVSHALGMSSKELFDPYKSEFIAYGTACVPAIVYHARVKQGIQCNYAQCLDKGISQMGLSVGQCDSNKAYDDCLRTSGNVLYALPYTNMFSEVASDVQTMMRDPAALLGGAIPLFCKGAEYFGIVSVHGGCVIAQTAMSLPTHYKRIRDTIDQFSHAAGMSSTVRDSCTPVLSGSLQAIKTSYENDAVREGFGYGRESHAEQNVEEYIIDGKSVKCAGNTCFIYDSVKSDAPLIGKTVTTLDGKVIVYGPEGMQEGYIYADRQGDLDIIQNRREDRLNKIREDDFLKLMFDELSHLEIQRTILSNELPPEQISSAEITELENKKKELESKIENIMNLDLSKESDIASLLGDRADIDISSNELALYSILSGTNDDGLVDVSKENMRTYFREYNNSYPLAFKYATSAADIRAEKAERLTAETELRDESQPLREFVDHFSRRTNYNDVDQDMWNKFYDETGFSKEDVDANLKTLEIDVNADPNMRSINKAMDKKIKEGRDAWSKRVGENLELAFNTLMVNEAERYESISAFAKVREGALGLSVAADIFGINNREWRDNSAMGQLALKFDSVAEPERLFCDSAFKNRNIPTEGGSGSVTVNTGGGTRPGAFITARKSTLQSAPGQDDMYHYWVEGGIETQVSGLKYKLYAYDSKGIRYDYTDKIVSSNNPVTTAGRISSFGGFGSARAFSSEVEYDRMCVYFDDSRPSDYFYSVRISGNELCQVFVGE